MAAAAAAEMAPDTAQDTASVDTSCNHSWVDAIRDGRNIGRAKAAKQTVRQQQWPNLAPVGQCHMCQQPEQLIYETIAAPQQVNLDIADGVSFSEPVHETVCQVCGAPKPAYQQPVYGAVPQHLLWQLVSLHSKMDLLSQQMSKLTDARHGASSNKMGAKPRESATPSASTMWKHTGTQTEVTVAPADLYHYQ